MKIFALKSKFLIILMIVLYYILYHINLAFNHNDYNIKKKFIFNNNTNKNFYKNMSDSQVFLKFQKMLPLLRNNITTTYATKEEIFNAREIYISDVRITPEYIKFIRPINETEEQKYIKHSSNEEVIIDNNLFHKRIDQYDYKDFCKLSLEEKLIDNRTISSENKPIISIVVPSYNKQNTLLKSIRSIQNQNFKNIEIIIVNDCSTDNSSFIFNYLLETDPRIRIFHHMINLGLYRARLNGILYSRGKYIIAFDAGDLYEDNYVLVDVYNIIEKYNLDSCKFIYRLTKNFNTLNNSKIYYHVGFKSKIKFKSKNIKAFDNKVFYSTGSIWNRLVRSNIYIKGLFLFNELMLNVYKNMWEDFWYNKIINKVSYSYAIIERVGYVYFHDGQGVGTPKFNSIEQKSNMIKEYVAFLYYDYNFSPNNYTKASIVKKLRNYNEKDHKIQLKYFRRNFEVLNNLLEALIKDPDVNVADKKYCQKLLNESKIREKEMKVSK